MNSEQKNRPVSQNQAEIDAGRSPLVEDNLCREGRKLYLEGMLSPPTVIWRAIAPINPDYTQWMLQTLEKFSQEDPSFCFSSDEESKEMAIFGTSDRHLDLYVERLKREYKVEVTLGAARVHYRETISPPATFNAHFVRQSGPGHYGHVIGRVEPCEEAFLFENRIVGDAIPEYYIPACERGFREASRKGSLAGYPVAGIKVILENGSYHEVDSREWSFRIAAAIGFKKAFADAAPILLEPIMLVEVITPREFTGQIQRDLLSRGTLQGVETMADCARIRVEVPLSEMLGYAEDLRGLSSGMADFSMEFACFRQVPASLQQQLIEEAAKQQE